MGTVKRNSKLDMYSNHKQSFKFESKKHAEELSKAIWNVRDERKTPLIEWPIVKLVPTYQYDSRTCLALHGTESDYFTSRQEKLAEQTIVTSF